MIQGEGGASAAQCGARRDRRHRSEIPVFTPRTFLLVAAAVLSLAHLTQNFFPAPYQMVKAVDNAAFSMLTAMNPQPQRACASDASGDC